MNTTKQTLEMLSSVSRPKLRISEIEALIERSRAIIPTPSRRSLVALCENGTLETAPRRRRNAPYLVYEDSFLRWIENDGF